MPGKEKSIKPNLKSTLIFITREDYNPEVTVLAIFLQSRHFLRHKVTTKTRMPHYFKASIIPPKVLIHFKDRNVNH